MKTLRLLVVVGLLIGSYHVGQAQSNDTQQFRSDAEKQAWINANEKDAQIQFNSDEEKQEWIKANPERYEEMKSANAGQTSRPTVVQVNDAPDQERVRTSSKETVTIPENTVKSTNALSTAKSGERKVVVRTNNTSKALPADYKSAEPRTSKSTD